MAEENKYKVEKTEKESSLIEMKAEIAADEFESFREASVKALGKDLAVPGFRKGRVPEKILIERMGEERILYEMAERAIRKAYPEILAAEHIDAIGEPKISITKIAKGNPLGFTIETTVLPEVKLPDYQAIAREKNKDKSDTKKVEVSDEEISGAKERIKASLAMQAVQEGKELLKDADGKPIVPELTDEKVKALGYKDLAHFEEKLREGVKAEKERAQKEKSRLEIAEAIIKETKMDVPEVLVSSEIVNMLHQFEHDVKRMGMKPDEYLKSSGKTREDLEKEWRPDAEKRVKLELILSTIARKEKIEPSKEAIEKETEHVLAHQPNADKNRVRAYVANLLAKEEIFKFLESQK